MGDEGWLWTSKERLGYALMDREQACPGVDVRGLYVYQVDWSRAPHYNHFAQTGNGRVLGPDEL